MSKKLSKADKRVKRHGRVRNDIFGTPEKPRLCVYRSLANISAQIIDDTTGKTLCSATSLEKDFTEYGGNKVAAKKVGEVLGKRALEAGIKEVCFDRAGYIYHGRVKELADGARSAGLNF